MTLAFLGRESQGCIGSLDLETEVRSQIHHDRELLASDAVASFSEVTGGLRVSGSRRKLNFDRHLAGDAFDAAEDLAKRRQSPPLFLLVHHRHEIDEPDRA